MRYCEDMRLRPMDELTTALSYQVDRELWRDRTDLQFQRSFVSAELIEDQRSQKL